MSTNVLHCVDYTVLQFYLCLNCFQHQQIHSRLMLNFIKQGTLNHRCKHILS